MSIATKTDLDLLKKFHMKDTILDEPGLRRQPSTSKNVTDVYHAGCFATQKSTSFHVGRLRCNLVQFEPESSSKLQAE